MIKLVAFDWNGTILDDAFACHRADNAALEYLDAKPISWKKFQETFEIPVINFYVKLGFDINKTPARYAKSEEIFHQTYDEISANVGMRLGARSLFKFLKKQNIPSMILSNHVHHHIKSHLARLKIEQYFVDIIANEHIGTALVRRAKGDKFKQYLKLHNINPKQVIMIGDTTEEIEIAHEIGAISVSVEAGYNTTNRLKEAKPDFLIRKLTELEKIISTL